MDKLFRLVKAVFFLVLAILLVVLAELFGQNTTAIAAIGVYGALLLSFIGIATGAFAIIDYNKERKEDNKE